MSDTWREVNVGYNSAVVRCTCTCQFVIQWMLDTWNIKQFFYKLMPVKFLAMSCQIEFIMSYHIATFTELRTDMIFCQYIKIKR